MRAWARGRVGAWSAALSQPPRLLACWLRLPGEATSGHGPSARGGTAGRSAAPGATTAGSAAPVFPVLLPAPHGRPWAPGQLGDPLDLAAPAESAPAARATGGSGP